MTNLGYGAGEPIAAVATALSPAAIGIVRTSGEGCIALVARLFSRPKALLEAGGNSLVYGWIVERGADGSIVRRIDEVMLGVYRKPRSFTGEEMVEIYCHGGIPVVKAILSLLLHSGFRQAERGEFSFRAYINGKADLTKAEAVKEIIDSKTDASRGRAAGRLAGALHEKIDALKQTVTELLASIEVAVEYPEDEETIADSFDVDALVRLQADLEALLAGWKTERLYQEGAKLVLAGRTNAGKSSLFNALLKEDRSIVSDVEGTTRDYLENMLSFDGIPVRIFDTAGIRQTDDPVEGQGVLRTRALAGEADLLLYLVDSTKGLCDEDEAFLAASDTSAVLVWNKCDREESLPLPTPASGGTWSRSVRVSAKTGQGMGDLTACVKGFLTAGAGTDGSAVALGSGRQRDAVVATCERLAHAVRTARTGELGLDAVVQDLEDALDFLGEITGEVTSDDVLESIFSTFCVGK
ncbi:MAG: tRNA uridine-5-carboxymethylaminomethyl(34) synthesis GTPase MnmE [Treponema sp.]|nr:tRNA uridine-5-carboxymethylaminomethyl(34) synthesis GTPase MnmE [Treponema sp.]